MSDSYIGEMRMFGGNFAPRGWAFCNGQIMPISQNTALFSLLGTMYGGDGRTNFALPNLQGSAPMHKGQGAGLSEHNIGEIGGAATVTLTDAEMPSHAHSVNTLGSAGSSPSPANNNWADADGGMYSDQRMPNVLMRPNAFGVVGSSLPHKNLPPYLALNFIIALQGIYPPRT
jgi:microcystin-dependent protein